MKKTNIVHNDELFYSNNKFEGNYLQLKIGRRQEKIKKYFKEVMMFFLKPFKCKMIDKFRQQLWDLEGHIKDEIDSLRNENICIREMILEIKRNNKELIEKQTYEISHLQNILIQQNEILLKSNKVSDVYEYLFVNDTFNTFHHGCSATSLAIKYHLQKKTDSKIIGVSWQDIGLPEYIYPTNINDFLSLEFLSKWESVNKDLVNKIMYCKHLIVNGEGCISHYNRGTLNLLYMVYISKRVYKKQVSIINHSIFTSNYVDNLTLAEKKDFEEIISVVYNELDNCKIREKYSKIQLDKIVPNKGELSFDCLPLYVEEIFPFKNKKNVKYITISGGNFLSNWYINFIKEILPDISRKFNELPIIFLYSDIQYGDRTGDMEIFDLMQKELGENRITLMKVSTTDEWLSVIQNSAILISGRFHHTIASFMLDTPFFVFKTNTKKVEGMLELIEKNECLLENDDVGLAVKKAKNLIKNDLFYSSNDSKIKEKIIELSKNNFIQL